MSSSQAPCSLRRHRVHSVGCSAYRVGQPIEIDALTLSLSASIGVALYPDDDEDADTLLRHADQAMYLAKQSGRNQLRFASALPGGSKVRSDP